uniref:Cystatin domain-containing protein n=1 Tax=Nelumbo nucifera TaxID=4432 RepID=A0A822XMW3_NELNU|nr:TPA_asm: hypothetical protein HUJ06_021759 [Nelumbo nucifera]
MKKIQSLLLFLFPLLLSFFLFDNVVSGALLGGWQPIQDVNDSHVQEIGQFAVTEYNKNAKTNLQFQKVVRGESQVVAGFNYRLILEATNKGVANNYEAVVWEQSWTNSRNLTSFRHV